MSLWTDEKVGEKGDFPTFILDTPNLKLPSETGGLTSELYGDDTELTQKCQNIFRQKWL